MGMYCHAMAVMLNFRPALEQDFPSIVELIPNEDELFLIYPAGKYPFTIDQLVELARQRLELTVACDGGRVVGFGNLYDYIPGEYVFIGNIYLSRQYRGSGDGVRLVRHMIELAFSKLAVPEVRLSVVEDNQIATRLYQKLGFERYADENRINPHCQALRLNHMKLLKSDYSSD